MHNNSPFVAIIILVWNNEKDTERCINSCLTLKYPNYKIYVVDNGSKDNCCVNLKKKFSTVEFIFNDENLGYAGGNNVGIKYALNCNADYIFILNNDTEIVNPECINILVENAINNPSLGILGPDIYDVAPGFPPGKHSNFNLYFDFLRKIGAISRKKILMPEEVKAVPTLMGAALFINSLCAKQVGLFKESFFMYAEETEYCIRAQMKGWVIAEINNDFCKIYHHNETYFTQKRPWQIFCAVRNGFQIFRSFYGCWKVVVLCIYTGICIRRLFLDFIRGNYKAAKAILIGLIFGIIMSFHEIIFKNYDRQLDEARNIAAGKHNLCKWWLA